MGCLRSAAAAFVLIVAVHMAGNADAAELKVISSGALKLALVQLVPEFQKSASNAVTIEYDVGAAITNRIQKGESADVVIVLRSQLQTLDAIQGAAPSFGVEVFPIDTRNTDELGRAITAFAQRQNGGLILTAPGASRPIWRVLQGPFDASAVTV